MFDLMTGYITEDCNEYAEIEGDQLHIQYSTSGFIVVDFILPEYKEALIALLRNDESGATKVGHFTFIRNEPSSEWQDIIIETSFMTVSFSLPVDSMLRFATWIETN